ncbi:MAG: hypothetical protein QT05_C0051G0002 [archaeon GW2011_AR13]|nr:MAG: hypothetical protein QT05_C0051G0002 [archaeon GW2011_AR13]HIG94919.1 NYN domain-containing protein [Nanoarchaeota archaeon]HIH63581.1 NYN domain-containing protein [Nanoarchaeota archaeon]HIJ10164.1 NYN domain-containing protein [Nanoarchaeota archaeon]
MKEKIYKDKKVNNNNMLPGNLLRLPDESLNSTLVFADAGFLSKLSGYFGNGKYLIYDLRKFLESFCKRQKLICKEIFYYTAPPFQKSIPTGLEEKKKEGYDKFIKKLKEQKIIVREGRCQKLKTDGKIIYYQKAVDVFLAMDLTNVLIDFPNVKRVILISSDSDFVPVIKNLEKKGVKTILYTYYEKKRNTNFSRSNDLIKSVYKYVLINKDDFKNCPLVK